MRYIQQSRWVYIFLCSRCEKCLRNSESKWSWDFFYYTFQTSNNNEIKTENVIELLRKWLYMKILLKQFSDGGKSLVNLYAPSHNHFLLQFSSTNFNFRMLRKRKIKSRVINSKFKALLLPIIIFYCFIFDIPKIAFSFTKLDCIYCSVIEIPTSR